MPPATRPFPKLPEPVMPTLTIDVSEAVLDTLTRRAEQQGQTVEALIEAELAAAARTDRDSNPDAKAPEYKHAAEAVLSENADLYERLS